MKNKLLLGLVAAASAAATGCAPAAKTRAVKAVPDRVAAATPLGALDRDRVITIVLGTKLHDEDQLAQTIAQVRGGLTRALTGREFGLRFSVDDAAYADLVAWAKANRLEVVRETLSHTTLTLRGRVEDLELALGVELVEYHDWRGTFFAPDKEPDYDGALADVTGVSGLSNASGGWYSKLVPHRPDTVPAPPANGYVMTDLQTLYNWPSSATGAGAHVAILGAGAPSLAPMDTQTFYNTPQVSDLTTYLGAAPSSYKQVQIGASGAADPGDSGTLTENTLDAEMVLTFAPQAQVDHVLVVNNAYGLFSDGVSYIVNDPKESTAQVVTLSYGSCEEFTAPEIPIENALFAQALAQGQQWFAASGDTGVDVCNDGAAITTTSADWPASSPYVLAVGGTQVYRSGGSYKEEAWGGASGGGGGGGGPSAMFAKPSWQMGKTINDGARDLPDVAALAGSPGVQVVVGGSGMPVNGTSAASPMWAGIWADLVQKNGGKGFTQGPVDLYTLAPSGGFTDITAGSNGTGSGTLAGFSAGPGYDLATGLGTPNVASLLMMSNWK